MLQRTRSKTCAKAKYLVMFPMIILMLTYVACSEGKTVVEESNRNITEMDDESLRKMYMEQIKQMEESGASEKEIEDAFFITLSEVQSKEDFYKSHTYLVYLQNKSFDRKKIDGTLNKEDEKRFNDNFEKFTYEEFLAQKNFPPPLPPPPPGENEPGIIEVKERTYAEGADVPFAVVDQVPVFPGCGVLGSNEEQKRCMSEKVQEFVTRNFDTGLGKKFGLTGVNQVNLVFKISPEGNITNVSARAPHPALEAEAIRVVEGLPKMIPGEQNGEKVGVSYSLPIVFQVKK